MPDACPTLPPGIAWQGHNNTQYYGFLLKYLWRNSRPQIRLSTVLFRRVITIKTHNIMDFCSNISCETPSRPQIRVRRNFLSIRHALGLIFSLLLFLPFLAFCCISVPAFFCTSVFVCFYAYLCICCGDRLVFT